jgi:hypothetical protein
VDTSPRSVNHGDLTARPKHVDSVDGTTVSPSENALRARLVASGRTEQARRTVNGHSVPDLSSDYYSWPIQAVAATPDTILDRAEHLLADARASCHRDGVPASRREMFARIAKRVGLPQAEVARRLRTYTPLSGQAPPFGQTATLAPDPISELANKILGDREREVFLARRHARCDDIVGLHQLATSLGMTVERIYQLEASARRKLAIAGG